jgi:uncharacterized protein YjbI with pentapeptide repeats
VLLRLIPLFALLALAPAHAAAPAYDARAVASVKAGNHNCHACDLRGADLTNTCVKNGDVQDARFDGAKLFMMCMSYADFRNASFRNADMAGANLAHAKLDGADFSGANLSITSIKGTDLTHTKGLTQAQLNKACGDKDTKLPFGMKVKTCS